MRDGICNCRVANSEGSDEVRAEVAAGGGNRRCRLGGQLWSTYDTYIGIVLERMYVNLLYCGQVQSVLSDR